MPPTRASQGPGRLGASALGRRRSIKWAVIQAEPSGCVRPLAKITSFRNVTLISGVIWAVWHWPLILFAAEVTDFDKVAVWFTLPVFSVTITITAASVVMAWLTLRSQSLWPAVILHGSQNAITQGFFSEYTSEADNTAYLVSEVGVLVAAGWVVAAYPDSFALFGAGGPRLVVCILTSSVPPASFGIATAALIRGIGTTPGSARPCVDRTSRRVDLRPHKPTTVGQQRCWT